MISFVITASTGNIKINYPPEFKGLELEEKLVTVVSDSFKSIGYNVIFTTLPNLRGLEEANNGNIDGEFPRAKIVADKYKNLFYLKVPLFTEKFFAYSLNEKYNTWKEIEGKKVGIHFGTKILSIVISKNTKKIETYELKDRKALYQMLKSGRVDLLFIQESLGDKIIEENNQSFIVKSDAPLYEDSFYLLLNKKYIKLQTLLEKELVKNLK